MLEEQNTPWGMKHRETALASTCGSMDVTVFPGNQPFLLRAVPIPSLFTLLPGKRIKTEKTPAEAMQLFSP